MSLKNSLRKIYREKRHEDKLINALVLEKLETLIQKDNCVALYKAIDNEINLDDFIKKHYQEQKICLPCVKDKTKILTFLQVTDLCFTYDAYHIAIPNSSTIIPLTEIDVMVLPCICVNMAGARLGYGGGYYDRTLRGYNGLKIGVVYDEGVINSPFAENFDICVDYIVTEKRIIKVEKKNV